MAPSRIGVLKKIAVLTSGGDAPGMNAAVRAVTRGALARGWEVFGVRNGYAGLLGGVLEPLPRATSAASCRSGGTVLGSARCPEFVEPAGRAKALSNLQKRGIEALVVIGGNGSQSGSASLAREGFAVVGVPSTIDNDLYGNDVSIGCDTAINITLEAIDRLRTTASSHQRAFAVETMGRDCGYIALMAGHRRRRRGDRAARERDPAGAARRAPARRLPPRQDPRARRDRRGREVRRARADGVLRGAPRRRSASTCA